jgi:alpha-tubulin suppressor-like RCC1 family protein
LLNNKRFFLLLLITIFFINNVFSDVPVLDLATEWDYIRELSLSQATDQANFQVKVTLDTATFGNPYSNINADGNDIRFEDSSGTLLEYWFEDWNNTGTSYIWIKVPDSSTDTVYMYYGNAAADDNQVGSTDMFLNYGWEYDDFLSSKSSTGLDYGRCASSYDNTVECWGYNNLYYNITGHTDGTANIDEPFTPNGLDSGERTTYIDHSTTGNAVTCVIFSATQKVTCWGNGGYGQLGRGNTTTYSLSTSDLFVESASTVDITNIVKVASGREQVCAINADSNVYCWGESGKYQTGDGSTVDNLYADFATGIGDARYLGITYHASFALMNDGTIMGWGDPEGGIIGNGNSEEHTPADLSYFDTAKDAVRFTVGYSGDGLVLTEDGNLMYWGAGWNWVGGPNGGETTPRDMNLDINGNIIDISMTYLNSCALIEDGNVYCWGKNTGALWGYTPDGMLGTGVAGSGEDSLTPVQVVGIDNAVALQSIYSSTCALLEDGTMKCWGGNNYGELGNNASGVVSNPTPVTVSGYNIGGRLDKVGGFDVNLTLDDIYFLRTYIDGDITPTIGEEINHDYLNCYISTNIAYDGNLVINSNVTLDHNIDCNIITITNNATLTIDNITNSYNTIQISAIDLNLTAGSTISANGYGYGGATSSGADGTGTGAGIGKTNANYIHDSVYGSGGSYGGLCGAGQSNHCRARYGNSLAPVSAGSGGGVGVRGTNFNAGDGGGAVKLVITDSLTIDGNINVNGTNAETVSGTQTTSGGGGSGGSIWVDTNTVSGSGYITAIGGDAGRDGVCDAAASRCGGGGGSGGRIAVYYNTNEFNVLHASVAGGLKGSEPDNVGVNGEPGSLAFISNTESKIILRQGWDFNSSTSLDYNEIIFYDTYLRILADTQIDANYFTVTGTTNIACNYPADNTLFNLNINVANDSNFTGFSIKDNYTSVGYNVNRGAPDYYDYGIDCNAINLSFTNMIQEEINDFYVQAYYDINFDYVGSNIKLIDSQLYSNNYGLLDFNTGDLNLVNSVIRGDLNLQIDSLEMYNSYFQLDALSFWDVNSLTIDSDSYITLYADGYAGAASSKTAGLGTGGGPNAGGDHDCVGGYGAAYGGRAGAPNCGGTNSNTYGNLLYPYQYGSGGGSGVRGASDLGANGGGIFDLDVNNSLILNGAIYANGASVSTSSTSSGGGGSGGSIKVDANYVEGSGTIYAMGGNADTVNSGDWAYGSAGGGGRVALYYAYGDSASIDFNVDPGQKGVCVACTIADSYSGSTFSMSKYDEDYSTSYSDNNTIVTNNTISLTTALSITREQDVNRVIDTNWTTLNATWTDYASNASTVATYVISGLDANTDYYVFDNGSADDESPITTNGSGAASFSVTLSSEHEIMVLGNQLPDINLVSVDGFDVSSFTYFTYDNNGDLNIVFNVADLDADDDLNIDINYVNSEGTHTSILDDVNLDSTYCEDENFMDSTTCFYDWNFANLVDGNYYLVLEINDSKVTDSSTTDTNFYIDNNAPAVSYSSSQDDYNYDLAITVSCSDAGSSCSDMTYRLDTNANSGVTYGSWQTYSSPFVITGDGNYAIDFNALDVAGNLSDTNTQYIILRSPHLNVKTYYPSDENSQVYFKEDENARIIVEKITDYYNPTIDVLDANGSLLVDDATMTVHSDTNKYYYDLNLDSDVNYGWLDVNVDGYLTQNVFYKSRSWSDDHTAYDTNIFPLNIDFNVTESEGIERNLKPVEFNIDINYGAHANSIRILYLDSDGNYLEVPSQTYNETTSSSYITNTNMIFFDSFSPNKTKQYLLAYAKSDNDTEDYNIDLNYYVVDNNRFFQNNYFKASFIDNNGGILGTLMQKTYSQDRNLNLENPFWDPYFLYNTSTTKALSESETDPTVTIVEDGYLYKKYNVTGVNNLAMDYNIIYTVYANKPYFKMDYNLLSNGTYSNANNYLLHFKTNPDILTKVDYMLGNSLSTLSIDGAGSANKNDVQDLNYFALYNDTNRFGFSILNLDYDYNESDGNPYLYVVDDSDTDIKIRHFDVYNGTVYANTLFDASYVISFFDSARNSRDVNILLYDLKNDLTVSVGDVNSYDSVSPINSDLNYEPYGETLYDTNTITCKVTISDALGLDYVDVNVIGPAINSYEQVDLNDLTDVNLEYTFDPNKGDYNCYFKSVDVVGNESDLNYVAVNSIQENSGPVYNSVSSNPDANQGVDPDTNVSVQAIIYEFTGMTADVNLYYRESGGDWNVRTMSCSNSDYNYLCESYFVTGLDENTYEYYISAIDTLDNDTTSDTYTLYSYADIIWSLSYSDDFEESGNLGTDVNLGTFTINNLSDSDLNITLTSNWDNYSTGRTYRQITYNTNQEDVSSGYNLLISADTNQDVNVVITTKDSASTNDINILITNNSDGLTPDSNYVPATIISSSATSPYLYSAFTTENILVTQADTGTNYVVKVTNYGGVACTTGTMTWTIPDDFTLSSGSLTNLFSLDPDEYESFTLVVDIDSDANLGTHDVNVSYSCTSPSTQEQTISTTTVVADVEGNTSTTTTTTTTTTGSGGSSGTSSAGGGGSGRTVDNIFEEEERKKLFETFEEFRIVRGQDNSFQIKVQNPFDDISIEFIKIQVKGLFFKYIKLEPSRIKKLGPGEYAFVTATITAPSYLERGSNILNFEITGSIEGSAFEGDDLFVEFTEKKEVTLKVFDVSQTDVLEGFKKVKSLVLELSEKGFYIGKIEQKLRQAELYFETENFSDAKQLIDEVEALKEIAYFVESEIIILQEKIINANARNIVTYETDRLVLYAANALSRGDFEVAKEIIEEAKMTFALETKGEFSFIYFLETYWYLFALGVVLSIIIIYFTIYLIRRQRLKMHLHKLKDEEAIILFMIKDAQKKCFNDNTISVDEYKSSLVQYEGRLNEILEKQISINHTLRYFRRGEKALMEEKQDLYQNMKKLQTGYFYDNNISSWAYEAKFRSLLKRIGDIEAKLANLEFKHALKKKK